MESNFNLRKIKTIIMAILLVFTVSITTVVPTYAAGPTETAKTAKASTKKAKKPKIKKSSKLYKEFTKNGLFDAEYYAAANPDLAAAYGNDYNKLLTHFLNYGIYEGRQCNAEFNVNAYSSAYGDLQSALSSSNSYQEVLNYYTHYITHGKSEGRNITTMEAAASAGVEVKKVGTDEVISAGTGTKAPAASAPAASTPAASTPAPSTPSTPSTPVHTHNYSNVTVTKEATRTEAGSKSLACSCGDSKTEAIPALTCATLGHEYSDAVTKEATVTEEGITTHTCNYCGDSYTTAIPKADCEHSYDDGVVTTEPNRTATGVKTYTCTNCGGTKTETVDKLTCETAGHGNTTETCISAETCTEAGTYKNVCEYCGEQLGDTFTKSALGHNYDGGVVTTQPTRTATGVKTYTCGNCGETKTEPVDKLTCETAGHGNTTETCISAETCTEAGTYKNVCEYCGEQVGDTFTKPALGHSYTYRVIREATTEEEGEMSYTCDRCNDYYTEAIPMIGACVHVYDGGHVTKRVTDEADGIRTYTCTLCGNTKTEPETYSCQVYGCYFVQVSDRYTGSERTKNYVCKFCGQNPTSKVKKTVPLTTETEVTDLEIIVLSNKTFEHGGSVAVWCEKLGCYLDRMDGYYGNAPLNCEDYGGHSTSNHISIGNGIYKAVCDVCGEVVATYDVNKQAICTHQTERSEIYGFDYCSDKCYQNVYCAECNAFLREEKQFHTHRISYFGVMPTCSENGVEYEVCACTLFFRCVLRNKPAHTYDSGVITVEPTCSSEGEKTYTCTECGATKTKAADALGHNYVENSRTPATCKDKGVIIKTCSRCQDVTSEDIEKTTNHIADTEHPYVITEATCTSTGVNGLKCSVCEKEIGTYITEVIPHNYSWVVIQELTATQDEIKEYRCGDCGLLNETVVTECDLKRNCKHNVRTITPVSAATCSSPAVYHKVCDNCSKIVSENYSIDTKLDANNHTYDEGVVTKEATKKEVGEKFYTCTGCGITKTETIEKISCNHINCPKYVETIDDVKWLMCSACEGKVDRYYDGCSHPGSRVLKTIRETNETQDGIYHKCCYYCGEVVEEVIVHAYKAYAVEVAKCNSCNEDFFNCDFNTLKENKKCTVGYEAAGTHLATEYVYGWLETDYDDTVINGSDSVMDHDSMYGQVFDMLNAYRVENGVAELEWNWIIQDAADTRAIESSYYFEHTRPSNTTWNTIKSNYMFGENIAIGYTTAERVMIGWKNSAGHNRNMLYPTFKSVAIGVFHRYTFWGDDPIPSERIAWSQEFSYIG